jgi:hypothetical protein
LPFFHSEPVFCSGKNKKKINKSFFHKVLIGTGQKIFVQRTAEASPPHCTTTILSATSEFIEPFHKNMIFGGVQGACRTFPLASEKWERKKGLPVGFAGSVALVCMMEHGLQLR